MLLSSVERGFGESSMTANRADQSEQTSDDSGASAGSRRSFFDPAHIEAPDDSGSDTMRRFAYQVHVGARAVLEMLERSDGSLTCEHLEDAVLQRTSEGQEVWAYCQIKTRDGLQAWTLATVISSKALKSLWRTWKVLPEEGRASAELWVLFEGASDPADDPLVMLERGQGHSHEGCLSRVARHLGVSQDLVRPFLERVRVQGIDSRGTIESLNREALSHLCPELTGHEVRAMYDEICKLVDTAMQGKLGARWQVIARQPSLPAAKQSKRISVQTLAELGIRVGVKSGVRLRYIATDGETTSDLVRKLRDGGASTEVIASATQMRAQADYAQLEAVASGAVVVDRATDEDLDQRLLAIARGISAEYQDYGPRPADRIYNKLLQRLEGRPPGLDRHPRYRDDPILLMGRACDLSDQCHFGWGQG